MEESQLIKVIMRSSKNYIEDMELKVPYFYNLHQLKVLVELHHKKIIEATKHCDFNLFF
jgi:hypothetical protein